MKNITDRRAAAVAAALLALAACAKKPDLSRALPAGEMLVHIRLDPDPPAAGENVFHVELMDAQGKRIDGAQVGLVHSMPAMGAMPEMKGAGETKALGNGKYDVNYSLSMLGDWYVTLGIQAPGHDPAELRFKISPPRKGYTVESRGAMPSREGAPQPIDMSPRRQQLIGVVYAKVERRPLSLTLRASGRVDVDETQVADVVLKYDAYVEKLFVDQTGQRVQRGDPLLTLYSPELLSAEQDYLLAVRSTGLPGSDQLVRAAEERLRLWNLSDAQLVALRTSGRAEPRVTIRSPARGTVLQKNVVPGAKAMAGTALYRVGNLGRIWVIADFFESDAPYVRAGLPATMTLASSRGSPFQTRGWRSSPGCTPTSRYTCPSARAWPSRTTPSSPRGSTGTHSSNGAKGSSRPPR
jgi:membrane fusion protein, copper/silver efflux system